MLMRDLCEYKEVPKMNIAEFQSIFSLHKKGQVFYGTKDEPNTHSFIVKVQVSVTQGNFPMLCYNKERNVQYLIAQDSELGQELKERILEKCPKVPKGYFMSFAREGVHYIKPKMLATQNW